MSQAEVKGRVIAGAYVVAAAGELDMMTSPQLERALSQAADSGHTRVVVDLTRVRFLDSTAVTAIIASLRRLRLLDGTLTIVCRDESVRHLLTLLGLADAVGVHETIEAAVAALAS